MLIHYCKSFQLTTLLLKGFLLVSLMLPAANASNTADYKLKNLLVLGDSLSAAYGIETQKGWVHLLQQHLINNHPDYAVINASISGETTAGALDRLPQLLRQYQPSIVIIELGGNDGLRGFAIPKLRQNLNTLIEMSQAANAKVLLTGIRIPPNYGKRYTQLFFESYSLSAAQYQIPLVPFFLDGIATKPHLMQPDRVHPTDTAQPKILQNVLPYLNTIL